MQGCQWRSWPQEEVYTKARGDRLGPQRVQDKALVGAQALWKLTGFAVLEGIF